MGDSDRPRRGWWCKPVPHGPWMTIVSSTSLRCGLEVTWAAVALYSNHQNDNIASATAQKLAEWLWISSATAVLWLRAAGSESFGSPQQLRPLDLHGRLWPPTAHLAKRAADLGGSHSFHGQSFCASPRPNQRPLRSNENVLRQTKSSISAWLHHPHPQTPVVGLGVCHISNRPRSKVPALATECCIFPGIFFGWKQQSHHYGEALYDDCICNSPICRWYAALCIRWQQRCHHCGEALYDYRLQKCGCM